MSRKLGFGGFSHLKNYEQKVTLFSSGVFWIMRIMSTWIRDQSG